MCDYFFVQVQGISDVEGIFVVDDKHFFMKKFFSYQSNFFPVIKIMSVNFFVQVQVFSSWKEFLTSTASVFFIKKGISYQSNFFQY